MLLWIRWFVKELGNAGKRIWLRCGTEFELRLSVVQRAWLLNSWARNWRVQGEGKRVLKTRLMRKLKLEKVGGVRATQFCPIPPPSRPKLCTKTCENSSAPYYKKPPPSICRYSFVTLGYFRHILMFISGQCWHAIGCMKNRHFRI